MHEPPFHWNGGLSGALVPAAGNRVSRAPLSDFVFKLEDARAGDPLSFARARRSKGTSW